MKKGLGKYALVPILVAVAILALGITCITYFKNGDGTTGSAKGNIVQLISKEAKKINAKDVSHNSIAISTSDSLSVAEELPDIDVEYPIVVQGDGEVNIEIWTSPEKGGSGKDGFLLDIAKEFNNARHTNDKNQTLSVTVRSIASGIAIDYMTSGKASPNLYTPSNMLWGEIAQEDGLDITLTQQSVVQNTAGILINNAKYKELNSNGMVDFKTVYSEVLEGNLTIGYPNPYSSSTGMNFLINALYVSDSNNLLSDTAIEQFQEFQKKVSLTSFTTQQLVKSAENGTVDCLVMEYQQYINDATIQTKYKFIPFGYSHNNPLYQIGSLSQTESEVVSLFVKECEENSALAKKNGFNAEIGYEEEMPEISGNTIKAAQSIWKESKDSGSSILIEFVFDISGSMENGNRYENLKTAFLNSMDYIKQDNYVGIISYDGKVYKDVSLDKLDISQKGKIKGALTEISPAGKTAMYDAIVVAMDELYKKEEALGSENIKKVIVVLTDGNSNAGRNDYSSTESLISDAGIPIYTISYDYDSYDLQNIADINEAEYINGTSEDIILKLKNLFQAIA